VKIVVIASNNPVKIRAVQGGFQRMFPGAHFEFQTIAVPSGVSVQPATDRETLLGATNRAVNAASKIPNADFWVGVEGGIEADGDEVTAFAWVVVKSPLILGKARTSAFYLPTKVVELIRQGKELGDADDIVFGRMNSKQENGAIGILTGDVIDRAQAYEMAVILALVPFKNPDLYSPG
jgi:inosine/xanthosine triphosphatase